VRKFCSRLEIVIDTSAFFFMQRQVETEKALKTVSDPFVGIFTKIECTNVKQIRDQQYDFL